VVITGLSGSGKSTVAKCFEDLGYYCVENLPLPLLSRFLDDPAAFVEGQHRIAVVADVRAPGFAAEAPRLFAGVDRGRVAATLVFLDSSDEALVRRFSETRRPHPLAGDGPPIEGIRREREMLSELRGAADLVLDTSDSSLHDIRALIFREFGSAVGAEPTMVVSLLSFGFKYGTPPGADLMFDVRFLPNPHFVPGLRQHSGCDSPVLDFLDAQHDFGEVVERLAGLLRFLLPRYRRENRSYLTIAIGCTGGRHRSVAAVERLARLLEGEGWPARIVHRDLDRERP
jgi:UPF0042 nucleotide-binding protein